MSTATVRHTHGPIPTIEEVYEATDGLIDAFNPIEHIAGSVEEIVRKWERSGEAPDPLPTIADVGALLVFCEHVEIDAQQCIDQANQVRGLLVVFENMRRETEVKGAKDA